MFPIKTTKKSLLFLSIFAHFSTRLRKANFKQECLRGMIAQLLESHEQGKSMVGYEQGD